MKQHALFAYGTLQLPEITERIIGRTLPGDAAWLDGYLCGLVARANFPGITAAPHCRVPGTLLYGVTQAELEHLDRYEGELYRRVRTEVRLSEQDSLIQCWVYVIAAWAQARVTDTPWTIEWYRQQGMKGRLTYRC